MFFQEEKYYPKAKLDSLFKNDISKLLERNILFSGNKPEYKFNFVGVISTSENRVFCVLPKVLEIEQQEQDKQEESRNTILCLKKYARRNTKRIKQDGVDYLSTKPDDSECAEIAVADFLIRDFKDNGIYIINKEKIERNGDGEIDWPLTITDIDATYSNGQPIYLETINHVSYDDQQHLTAEIHKWSLGYIEKYCDFLGESSLFCKQFYRELDSLGSVEYLIQHLNKELHMTFADRGIRLLKSLRFLLEKKAKSSESSLTLFGTRSFELVWENICSEIVNDNKEKIKDENDKLFSQPSWKLFDEEHLKTKTHIPDILHKYNETLYIYDAKYYKIYKDKTIKNESLPGYKDVLKQFLYEQHLSKTLKVEKTYNAFLFPISDREFDKLKNKNGVTSFNAQRAVIGSVTYDVFEDKKIFVIMCPFSRWQKMYIKNQSLPLSEIKWQ